MMPQAGIKPLNLLPLCDEYFLRCCFSRRLFASARSSMPSVVIFCYQVSNGDRCEAGFETKVLYETGGAACDVGSMYVLCVVCACVYAVGRPPAALPLALSTRRMTLSIRRGA